MWKWYDTPLCPLRTANENAARAVAYFQTIDRSRRVDHGADGEKESYMHDAGVCSIRGVAVGTSDKASIGALQAQRGLTEG